MSDIPGLSYDLKHNHVTRDMKEFGECPLCDHFHFSFSIKVHKEKIASLQAELAESNRRRDIAESAVDKFIYWQDGDYTMSELIEFFRETQKQREKK